MTADEIKIRQRRSVLLVAGVAAVLIALVIGLSTGDQAKPDEADNDLTTKQIFERAREKTLAEVKKDSADQGFEDGRKSGSRHGVRAGRRAGEADGAVAAQLEITSAAQAAAANAQAELDSISAVPPPPEPTTTDPLVKPGR